MLKYSLILSIAIIAMVSAGKIPAIYLWTIRDPQVFVPAPLVPITSAPVIPAPAPNTPAPVPKPPVMTTCVEGKIYRENCNICICYPTGLSCTTINCASLPEKVKKGNAVADSDLPKLPASDDDVVVGQVYRDLRGYYCVAAEPKDVKCYT